MIAVIHDAVVMIKVCHVMSMMWGCGNVCVMIIMKKNIKKNKKICPSGAYTDRGS